MRSRPSLPTRVCDPLALLARGAAVGITTFPALGKFVQYSDRVAQFEAWGLPWPEVAVLVAGTVQLLALLTIALGLGGRFGAAALACVMVVAMAAAGPNPFNGTVFVSAVLIVLLGTGRYSVWDPAVATFPGSVDRRASSGE